MIFAPATLADLSRQLADCHAARLPVTAVDLAALAAVREYTPEDMTITAEGVVTSAPTVEINCDETNLVYSAEGITEEEERSSCSRIEWIDRSGGR